MSAYAKLTRAMAIEPQDLLYVPSGDVAADTAFYGLVLGARLVWERDAMGTRVAELELSPRGTRLALAEDRALGAPVLMRRVADLDTTLAELRARGLEPTHGSSSLGPCVALRSPGGQELGLYEPARAGLELRTVASASAEPQG